jgi:hypothetical protein
VILSMRSFKLEGWERESLENKGIAVIQMRVRFDSEGHVSVFVLFLGEMGRGYARLPFEDNRGCP